MSLTTDLVSFFLRQEPGSEFTAGEVQTRGGFTSSQNVYAQLAILAQPGGPFMRERKSGIYHYRVRPGFDLSEYHKASRVTSPKPQAPATLPAAPKPAAAQVPESERPRADSPVTATTSAVQSDSTPAPAAAPETPEAMHKLPFLPMDDPNPHRAEVLRFIGDLRIKRDAINEIIQSLESTFGVKT